MNEETDPWEHWPTSRCCQTDLSLTTSPPWRPAHNTVTQHTRCQTQASYSQLGEHTKGERETRTKTKEKTELPGERRSRSKTSGRRHWHPRERERSQNIQSSSTERLSEKTGQNRERVGEKREWEQTNSRLERCSGLQKSHWQDKNILHPVLVKAWWNQRMVINWKLQGKMSFKFGFKSLSRVR